MKDEGQRWTFKVGDQHYSVDRTFSVEPAIWTALGDDKFQHINGGGICNATGILAGLGRDPGQVIIVARKINSPANPSSTP